MLPVVLAQKITVQNDFGRFSLDPRGLHRSRTSQHRANTGQARRKTVIYIDCQRIRIPRLSALRTGNPLGDSRDFIHMNANTRQTRQHGRVTGDQTVGIWLGKQGAQQVIGDAMPRTVARIGPQDRRSC